MSSSIRGHQGQIKLFQDGGDLGIVNLTSVDISQDSSFIKSYYVGQSEPENDQAMEGWSGTLEAEVKGDDVDKMIDALVTNNLNGIGVSDYSMISTELYADGTQSSYVYYGMVFKMSKKQGGLQEKITKRLEFSATGRKRLG